MIQSNKLIVFHNPDTTGATFEVVSNVLDVCYWPTAGGVIPTANRTAYR